METFDDNQIEAKQVENPQQILGDFDPKRVHYIDPKTKRLSKVNPFRVHMINRITYYEWPAGSGNLWYKDRTAAGILDEHGKPVIGVPHKTYVMPKTQDDSLRTEVLTVKQQNAKLQAELDAIKKEQAMAEFVKKELNKHEVKNVAPSSINKK